MVTEGGHEDKPILHYGYIKIEPSSVMDPHATRRGTPSPERVSSAADAMLKLSNSALPAASDYSEMAQFAGLPAGQAHHHGPLAFTNLKSHLATSPAALLKQEPDSSPRAAATSPRAATNKAYRKQREFIPDFRKDSQYWLKRRKNNEAAKRSREKRRVNDMVMGQQIMDLQKENDLLRQELHAIKLRFGLPPEQVYYDPNGPPPQRLTYPPPSAAQGLFASQDSNSCDSSASSTPSKYPSTSQTPLNPISLSPSASAISTALLSSTVPVLIQKPAASSQVFMSAIQGMPASQQLAFSSAQMTESAVHAEQAEVSRRNGVVENPEVSPSTSPSSTGAAENEAVTFHSKLKAPDICRPISPESACSSPRSPCNLTIAISPHSSADESEHEGPRHKRHKFATSSPSTPSPSVLPKASSQGTFAAQASAPPRNSLPGSPFRYERSRERKGIPHKLRHKEQFLAREDSEDESRNITPQENRSAEVQAINIVPQEHQPIPNHMPMEIAGSFITSESDNSLSNLNEKKDSANSVLPQFYRENDQGDDSHSSSVDSDTKRSPSGSNVKDVRYYERRNRNNQAARKCRENRKVLSQMRLEKSTILEVQNDELKQEMKTLSEEVSKLKDLINKKNDALARGETFEPPPLEVIHKSIKKE